MNNIKVGDTVRIVKKINSVFWTVIMDEALDKEGEVLEITKFNNYEILIPCVHRKYAFLYPRESVKKVNTLSRKDLLEKIFQQKGFFSVKFIKKDLSERKMLCMFGVKKHLKHGGERKPTVDLDKFFVVFDVKKGEYRAVNKETIFEAKIDKEIYVVKE